MRRRIAILALAILGGLLPAGAANAAWACVGIYRLDYGICVDDPLPDPLPLPDVGPDPLPDSDVQY